MKSGELVAALKMFPGKYSLTHWDFKHSLTHWDFVVFSSPEPKAQVRFSDHYLSVVYRRHRCFCKFFTLLSSSPELLVQFQPNLAQASLGKRNSDEGPCHFSKGENNKLGK